MIFSALVGITMNHFVHEPLLAMPLAASASIWIMFTLKCLHPHTAVTFITVLANISHYRYAFFLRSWFVPICVGMRNI